MAADNSAGKIYHPYVQQLENELEYELIIQDDDRSQFSDQQLHRFAYGQSINDQWFIEAGIIASDLPGQDFDISGYELEAKYQITE